MVSQRWIRNALIAVLFFSLVSAALSEDIDLARFTEPTCGVQELSRNAGDNAHPVFTSAMPMYLAVTKKTENLIDCNE